MTIQAAGIKVAVAGLTGLIGIATSVTIPATLQALDLFNTIQDKRRRGAAKDLAKAVAAEIAALQASEYAREPAASTFASALATAGDTLDRHRLTSAEFLKLQLEPERAADAVLAHARFNRLDGDALPATARRILDCFYAKLRDEKALLEAVLPDLYGEIMRQGTTLDRVDARTEWIGSEVKVIRDVHDSVNSVIQKIDDREYLKNELNKKEQLILRLRSTVRQQAKIIMELTTDAN